MPLEFLTDRDLGKRVPAILRVAGFTIHTLVDIYGEEQAQLTHDTEWIEHAGTRGWVALTRNRKIRYVTEEREAVAEHGLPLFALSSGNLDFTQAASAFLAAMPRIHELCSDPPGGTIWIVHRDGRVGRYWPPST